MKTIVLAGRRLFMKWDNIAYFEERAKEANAAIVPVRSEDENDFRSAVKDASAIIVIAKTISREAIESLSRCELILTLSVGHDCVDVNAATKRGIPVSNVPAYCTDDVANHSMSLLMAVARKLTLLNHETKHTRWDYNVAKPIYTFRGKCLGLIGLGKIGRAIVPKAKGLGMQVAAYDPYVHDDIFQLLDVKREYELNEMLKNSDYISIHAPLTPETYHLLDKKALGLLRKHVVIVNTSRGNIIDEQALYESLKSGRVAGAGIDVMSSEPPDESFSLLYLDNALVTPHIAWYSEESLERVRIQGMDETVNVLNGKRPRYIVNPEVFGFSNTD
ncbi:MAG: C-terminal binding protein [Spirochaetota bacterium]|nr:MAG: C-terminal binding protein [Spirochaetota bacterium]